MSNFFHGKMFAKISELDETIDFDTADEFVVVNGHITQKITGQNLTESIVSIGNLASKAYVDAVVDGAPELLNTLNEIAAALNDDENFASHIISSIETKLSTANFGLEFWNALAGVTTFNIPEDTNLYFTEQRVLDVITANLQDRLVSNGNELVLGTNGTLNTPLLLPITFTATLDTAHCTSNPGAAFTAEPWYYDITFACNPDGTVETQIDSNRVWPLNWQPNYGTNATFDFTEADHGIPGYTLTLIVDEVSAGIAGWALNIAASPPPEYPSTIKSLGAIKVTANESSWTFGTDGKLTLPVDPTSSNHAATKGYVDSQLNTIESDRLINGSFEVILQDDGTLVLPADPTSSNHAATKGYVDNQVDYVVAGQGFATLGYVEDAISNAELDGGEF